MLTSEQIAALPEVERQNAEYTLWNWQRARRKSSKDRWARTLQMWVMLSNALLESARLREENAKLKRFAGNALASLHNKAAAVHCGLATNDWHDGRPVERLTPLGQAAVDAAKEVK